jgi:hypothetical protein
VTEADLLVRFAELRFTAEMHYTMELAAVAASYGAMTLAPLSLDGILDALNHHHQRATYGAVAGLLGFRPARS